MLYIFIIFNCIVINIPAAIFNYPPLWIIIPTSLTNPLATASCITTLSIAVDRAHGIYFPISYSVKNKQRYAVSTGALGCLACLIEIVIIYSKTIITEHPGCPAFGCFVSATYLT